MAAIDFPTPSGVGATFAAGNGVVYTWSGTVWLASGASAGGDFCATNSANIVFNATTSTLVLNTVINGNDSGAYSTSTGRYTPPAGRYSIIGSIVGNATVAGQQTFQLRKNGVTVATSGCTIVPGNITQMNIDVIVDANGTDYFELVAGSASVLTCYGGYCTFSAFPISGVKGPPGDPGPAGSVPTGDFSATNSGTINVSNGPMATIVPNTIQSGNSGAWYSTSTGRYVPPAGRYFIIASLTGIAPAGVIFQGQLTKNGVQIVHERNTTFAASAYGHVTVNATVDCNGVDYIELQAASNAASTTISANYAVFTAFPISGVKGPTGDPGAGGPPGEATTVLQTRMFQTGAAATGTTVMVYDDTIPQITEGTEFMTLAFTPTSATSKLIITVNAALSHSAAVAIIGALFRDSTANALASMYLTQAAGNQYNNLSFAHTMTSGTTSPINFRFRAGGNAPGTLTFNGQVGARLFGGVMASSIVIQEVSP